VCLSTEKTMTLCVRNWELGIGNLQSIRSCRGAAGFRASGFGLQEILVYLAYLVCFVIARNKVAKQSSCFAAGFGFRVQGVTSTKMVIARAKPVAIYDIPLFFS